MHSNGCNWDTGTLHYIIQLSYDCTLSTAKSTKVIWSNFGHDKSLQLWWLKFNVYRLSYCKHCINIMYIGHNLLVMLKQHSPWRENKTKEKTKIKVTSIRQSHTTKHNHNVFNLCIHMYLHGACYMYACNKVEITCMYMPHTCTNMHVCTCTFLPRSSSFFKL